MRDKNRTREDIVQQLKDAGCTPEIIEEYFKYEEQEMYGKQCCLLSDKRSELLEDVHSYEKKLDCLDYLIYKIKKKTCN